MLDGMCLTQLYFTEFMFLPRSPNQPIPGGPPLRQRHTPRVPESRIILISGQTLFINFDVLDLALEDQGKLVGSTMAEVRIFYKETTLAFMCYFIARFLEVISRGRDSRPLWQISAFLASLRWAEPRQICHDIHHMNKIYLKNKKTRERNSN